MTWTEKWWRARSERPGRRDNGKRDRAQFDRCEIKIEVRSRSAGDTTNSTTQTQNLTNNPPKTPTQLIHLLSQPIPTQSIALPLDKERRKKIFGFDLRCKERERHLRLREELRIWSEEERTLVGRERQIVRREKKSIKEVRGERQIK